MNLYIFRKENDQNDFTKVQVDLIRPQSKSVFISYRNKTINLEWDSDYSFTELLIDDILLVYILGEDLTRGYILPHLRDLSIKDLTVSQVIKSALDKIKQSSAKEKATSLEVLKSVVQHYADKDSEDLDFVQDLFKHLENSGDSTFQQLKDFMQSSKDEKKPSKEKL